MFYVGESNTPCTNSVPGFFQLTDNVGNKLKCIALPEIAFNYTSGTTTSQQSDVLVKW